MEPNNKVLYLIAYIFYSNSYYQLPVTNQYSWVYFYIFLYYIDLDTTKHLFEFYILLIYSILFFLFPSTKGNLQISTTWIFTGNRILLNFVVRHKFLKGKSPFLGLKIFTINFVKIFKIYDYIMFFYENRF